MREDRHTNTPDQAAAFEARRGADAHDPDRPTLAEATRDECAHPRRHNVAHPGHPHILVCWDCGQVCDE